MGPNRALLLYSDSHLRFMAPKSIRENLRYGIYGEFSWAFDLEGQSERNTQLILRTRANYGPRLYRALTLPLILAGVRFSPRARCSTASSGGWRAGNQR
jgi:hypothetical protein